MNENDMIIQNVVANELELIKDYSTDGLCIYLANNIQYELKNEGISSRVFATDDYAKTSYHHVFIIAKNGNNKNVYLIDPSYSQFMPKSGHALRTFTDWPANILSQTEEGKKILNDLLTNGYSIVSKEDIETYLNSFVDNINYEYQSCQRTQNHI